RRLARAASGRVYADAAGITEQVEEAFAAAHRADARAQWPVIQEQPRVEVIPKIDEELQSVLADFDVLATLVEAAVFLAALAALARFQRDLVARNSKCLAGDAHGFAQPRARKIFIDRRGRLVFLDVQVVLARQRAVDVDRRRVLGQVGVVDA